MWFAVGFGKHCTSALAFPAGHSWQCVPRFSDSSLAVGFDLDWMFFPVPYLLELCETAHAGLTVLLGPSMTFLLSVYTPFLLWQHRGVDSWDLYGIEIGFDLLHLMSCFLGCPCLSEPVLGYPSSSSSLVSSSSSSSSVSSLGGGIYEYNMIYIWTGECWWVRSSSLSSTWRP